MKRSLGIAMFALFTLCACISVFAGDKVLLVHSYHKEYPWVADITAGVEKGLKGSGAKLEIFYMDTKRKNNEEWKVKAGQMAKEKVAAFKPDVVITADDDAQAYFAKDYVGKDKPQFVFCGVNAEPSQYGFPASNVTGILEKPFFVETLNLLKTIDSKIKTVAIIGDDSSTTAAIYAYIKKLDTPLKVVAYEQLSTFDKWQSLIHEYQNSVDAILITTYHTIKKKAGENSMDPKEVMNWTLANSKKPTISFFSFAVEDGVLCGVVEFGEEHGSEAAGIAVQILKGKKASDFTIKTAKKGLVMINLKTAASLGIEIPANIVKSADKVIGKK